MHVNATVIAKSSKDSISFKKGRYHITVRAPAEGGKANNAARVVLAEVFDVPLSSVSLIRGATQPSKIFLIRE